MKKCHACGEVWEGPPGAQPGRNETCPRCGADLHCCLNCRHYDPAVHHECLSSTAEFVRDKDRRNYCDEFEFSGGAPGKGPRGGGASEGDMDRKWKDLFGG